MFRKRIVFVTLFVALIVLTGNLVGCNKEGEKSQMQVLDGPGMVYSDVEYRTEFANCLSDEGWTQGSENGGPMWAVAFLGYGDAGKANADNYIKKCFDNLPFETLETIPSFEYEGDEWYLFVPRYKDANDIVGAEDNKIKDVVYQGEAFLIRCNISDLHSNIKVKVDSHGGHTFSPQIDGQGRLIVSEDVWDITEY